jgi:hypothetical protein
LAGVGVGLWKTRQIVAQVDQSPARNRNGPPHHLAAMEQLVLAHYLPHQSNKHFWHIIIEGILLLGLTLLVLRVTGMIPAQ